MSDLPPLPTLATGRWRHYKGGRYEVLGVVRHSETLEPLVLYRPLAGDTGTWVRPFAMFQETVVHDGRAVPRFEPEVLGIDVDDADLSATVRRMEARLATSSSAAVGALMQRYRVVADRFERDLAARPRDVDLAKSAALMLVQAVAAAEPSVSSQPVAP